MSCLIWAGSSSRPSRLDSIRDRKFMSRSTRNRHVCGGAGLLGPAPFFLCDQAREIRVRAPGPAPDSNRSQAQTITFEGVIPAWVSVGGIETKDLALGGCVEL